MLDLRSAAVPRRFRNFSVRLSFQSHRFAGPDDYVWLATVTSTAADSARWVNGSPLRVDGNRDFRLEPSLLQDVDVAYFVI
jgi:hypothetical protein